MTERVRSIVARGEQLAMSADRVAVVIIIIGGALRCWWVLSASVGTIDDSAFYNGHAVDLAAGRGYLNPATGAPSAFLPPGYSLALAAVYLVTGPSVLAGAVLNVAFAVVTMVFTYLIARRAFGTGAARLATVILAAFPSQIVYTPALTPDLFFTMLVMAVLWAGLVISAETGRARFLLLGILLGVAVLTAPKVLVLAPLLVFAASREVPRRVAARRSAYVFVTMLVLLIPWTVRNAIQLDAPVFVSTNSGVNLWIGSNPEATGGWMPWDPNSDGWTYPEDEIATDREFRERALDYAFDHPLDWLKLTRPKLEETFRQDFSYLGHFSLVTRDKPLPGWMPGGRLRRIVNAYYDVICWAAVAGVLVLIAKRNAASISLVAAVVLLILPGVLLFGLDRYHVVVLPLFCILAAGGAAILARDVRTLIDPPRKTDPRPPRPGSAR
ncbi:MAG: glycosyltransferase family 39 protein [Tepidiformaceae bacterium]